MGVKKGDEKEMILHRNKFCDIIGDGKEVE